jgi:hypothetical protein
MQRILLVLTVALGMIAMMLVTAAPAFADCCNASGHNPGGKTVAVKSQNPND